MKFERENYSAALRQIEEKNKTELKEHEAKFQITAAGVKKDHIKKVETFKANWQNHLNDELLAFSKHYAQKEVKVSVLITPLHIQSEVQALVLFSKASAEGYHQQARPDLKASDG